MAFPTTYMRVESRSTILVAKRRYFYTSLECRHQRASYLDLELHIIAGVSLTD